MNNKEMKKFINIAIDLEGLYKHVLEDIKLNLEPKVRLVFHKKGEPIGDKCVWDNDRTILRIDLAYYGEFLSDETGAGALSWGQTLGFSRDIKAALMAIKDPTDRKRAFLALIDEYNDTLSDIDEEVFDGQAMGNMESDELPE